MTLTIGDPDLGPGEYRGSVVFITNAPKPRRVTVDVTLTVALPDSWGAISGRVIDAHSPEPPPGEPAGIPIPGVAVTFHSQWNGAPLDVGATTAADGTYTIVAPSGTWPLEFAKDGYVGQTRNEVVTAGTTQTVADALLHKLQPHGTVQWDPLTFTLTPGHDAHGTIVIANKDASDNDGHANLTFDIGEVNLGGADARRGHGQTPARQGRRPERPLDNGREPPGSHDPARDPGNRRRPRQLADRRARSAVGCRIRRQRLDLRSSRQRRPVQHCRRVHGYPVQSDRHPDWRRVRDGVR